MKKIHRDARESLRREDRWGRFVANFSGVRFGIAFRRCIAGGLYGIVFRAGRCGMMSLGGGSVGRFGYCGFGRAIFVGGSGGRFAMAFRKNIAGRSFREIFRKSLSGRTSPESFYEVFGPCVLSLCFGPDFFEKPSLPGVSEMPLNLANLNRGSGISSPIYCKRQGSDR